MPRPLIVWNAFQIVKTMTMKTAWYTLPPRAGFSTCMVMENVMIATRPRRIHSLVLDLRGTTVRLLLHRPRSSLAAMVPRGTLATLLPRRHIASPRNVNRSIHPQRGNTPRGPPIARTAMERGAAEIISIRTWELSCTNRTALAMRLRVA